MALWKAGLRAKSIVALLLACLAALIPAGLLGWQLMDNVRNHFGEAYARNLILLQRQTILAPVARDIALARRLANSEVTIQWLRDEQDPGKTGLLFREAEKYRQDLHDHAYFIASADSGNYYFNDDTKAYSQQPRYTLSPTHQDDTWFYSTLQQEAPYSLNVNHDAQLQVTQVWVNVPIRDNGEVLGLAGSGFNLSEFVQEFIANSESGVTPMLINRNGIIQAHQNENLIALNQAAGAAVNAQQTLAGQLGDPAQATALEDAMQLAQAEPGTVQSLFVDIDQQRQLLTLTYLPELDWYIVLAVDLQAARGIDTGWFSLMMVVLVVLLAVLILAFGYAVERLVLRPVRDLQRSAQALAAGHYDVVPPSPRHDELGDLNRAFSTMAAQIRNHTQDLEGRIQARTQELEQANDEMRRAHQQINDSIEYASLIQRAILPDEQLRQLPGLDSFVLWRPRDIVGGDFYLCQGNAEQYILGVVDCAGHGVPGALMTMLARAALDHAVAETGRQSPAAILHRADQAMREMMHQYELPRGIATNMDVGLVCIDRTLGLLRFAGARIGLYWSDGHTVDEVKGHRRAIGDRRQGTYTDQELALRTDVTYYLVTDGFLDQAGGEFGYGFGHTRLAQLLLENARLPQDQRAAALEAALETYRGNHPQRDDITVLSFHFHTR
ncbi:biofilm regulation protein phosphatase SiaA [Corticimicrobacter populi]|uniref:Histidine kinase n=1 Tax=Corticimicrobacter populi TaxID=2175229 RepID=A0A2V1K1P7_9BURK|nr:biofilm regulation protein phosphatase SiaA [Corticimicrobacter populi]PWF22706.1 histidine kinase [Corticimicrobacter populi]